MKTVAHLYPQIISIENLLDAWNEFIPDKKQKNDVRVFASKLLLNINSLHHDLINFTYKHGGYQRFHVNDPKARIIHKATVRDRLLHHAIYRILYPIFDKGFTYDSYSCRLEKGTHRAVKRLENFTLIVSRNYSRPCYVLKCDVKKFFDSVDHKILIGLLKKKVSDTETITLLTEIIKSFSKTDKVQLELFDLQGANREREVGLPIGNLTSQLFANVYLDELDQFIKHHSKIKYYLRYCDDFIILDNNRKNLENLITQIQFFLDCKLALKLHPKKIIIRKLGQGIDFLGYIILPHYILPRKKTVRRIIRNFKKMIIYDPRKANASLQSNLGYLGHANAYKISELLRTTAA